MNTFGHLFAQQKPITTFRQSTNKLNNENNKSNLNKSVMIEDSFREFTGKDIQNMQNLTIQNQENFDPNMRRSVDITQKNHQVRFIFTFRI
jgi:hypothetical protein